MKTSLIFFTAIFLLSINLSFSQTHKMNTGSKSSDPAVIIPGLGNHQHKVSTENKMAQKFFNQGLTLIYAFNHNEAIRSFQKAAELDPMLAMAYWGIAYSLGPNYNLPADNEQRKLAYKSMRKALKHSTHVTQKEKDYIQALSKRYTKNVDKIDQQTLDLSFKNAMKTLYRKYPDDPDAATLYAESMMNLKPWQLWNKDGTPAEGTLEIVSVLETVIEKDPDHPGANHYYIHAVEASDDPGKALASANVLKDLIPAAGHLVHMPAHILFRIGDYEGASVANVNAIESDESYIKNYNPQGIYPLMYYNHNINFLSVSEMMQGKYKSALESANKIAANVEPALSDDPMFEGFYANPLLILVSFSKWNEIISLPEANTSYKLYSALLNFSKGLAYASNGNTEDAKSRLDMFIDFKSAVSPEALVGLTPAPVILNLSEDLLKSKIALAEGDTSLAISLLKSAVEDEDLVNYNEPPDWYPSARLFLGSALYLNGDFVQAEQVFREELKKYPHNGRGLYGLMECLKAQGKDDESKIVSDEFIQVWEDSEVQLSMNGF